MPPKIIDLSKTDDPRDVVHLAVQALADGESLTDNFNYTVGDGHGGTATATLTITISGENDTPVAVLDGVAIAEDTLTSVSGNVLNNDTDPNLDPLTAALIPPLLTAAGGTFSNNGNGTITYTPDPTFTGLDSIAAARLQAVAT